jgi:hypothetical protein
MVFTMGVASDRLGFSNRADYVLLSAPDGKAVETVKWGDIKEPADHGWLDEVPSISQSSVQRRGMTGGFEPHDDFEGQRSSPGVFPLPEPAPASAPAPAADPAKPTAKPGSDAPK